MKRSCFLSLFALLTLMYLNTLSQAHNYRIGDLKINHPYTYATVSQQTPGSAYVTVENKGSQPDTLVAVSTPMAQRVEMHTMQMDRYHVMRMRELTAIEIAPNSTLTMAPQEGYHLMLMGLKAPLKYGQLFPMTLTFKKAGDIKIDVHVNDMKPFALTEHR